MGTSSSSSTNCIAGTTPRCTRKRARRPFKDLPVPTHTCGRSSTRTSGHAPLGSSSKTSKNSGWERALSGPWPCSATRAPLPCPGSLRSRCEERFACARARAVATLIRAHSKYARRCRSLRRLTAPAPAYQHQACRSLKPSRENVTLRVCNSLWKTVCASGECWLLVVGCWLLVVGCWLLVVGCVLCVSGQVVLVVLVPA